MIKTERFKPAIEWVTIGSVTENPNNPQVHSLSQIRKLADSIKSVGITYPCLVDDGYALIAGHGRLRAFKKLGLETVPVIRLSHLTPAQVRAYAIADNRLGDLSSFDKKLLGSEIELILAEQPEFDIELTGFDESAVELILDQTATAPTEQGSLPATPPGPPVTRVGDLWHIGDHRLLVRTRENLRTTDYCWGQSERRSSYRIFRTT